MMEVQGIILNDVRTIGEFVKGKTWLEAQTLDVLTTFAGDWCQRASVDKELYGFLAAVPGEIPEFAEPDSDADENFTEDGQWVDEVDPSADLVFTHSDPPEFKIPQTLVILDVVGDREASLALLRHTINSCRDAGFSTIAWPERPDTKQWIEILKEDLLQEYGGVMSATPYNAKGIGDAGFWVSF